MTGSAQASARANTSAPAGGRPRVVFEQYVIPAYRVPFFAALAQRVDLLVIASQERTVDGVTDIRDGLPFAAVRLAEKPGTAFHPDIVRCLDETEAQVWISYDHSPGQYADCGEVSRYVAAHDVRRLVMGCQGYEVRDFAAYRRLRASPWRRPRTYLGWRRLRRRLRGLDGFVVHSAHTASFFEEVYDVPAERIAVCHNAIDTHLIEEVRRRRESASAARDPLRVGFVGRMTEGKRVDTLLHAFAEISRRWPQSSLVLVGDGSAREGWQRLASGLGLANVDFRGAVFDQRELAEILCECSLFVLPGLGGLALNAAMAAGLPVICSHADGTELDLVHEGVNGWHVPPRDTEALTAALAEALADDERLGRMGHTSAEMIEGVFNLEAMVDVYVASIELALGRGPRRRDGEHRRREQ